MLAIRVEGIDNFRTRRLPGSFCLTYNGYGDVRGMNFFCPCGCGNESYLNFNHTNGHPCWIFDGDKDHPTLHPSVSNTGMPCKWHGWLKDGFWKRVG